MRVAGRKPGRSDVSRPDRSGDYAYSRRFYRSRAVAEDYDFHRLGSPGRRRRDERKWRTLQAALSRIGPVQTILDVPCGTGRFTGRLAERGYDVVGSDISREMMDVARTRADHRAVLGFVQADAEALPFRDASVDCVVSIRFLFHADPAVRVSLLREMRRVSKRWLIVDYRHRYTLRYLAWRVRKRLGLTREALDRVGRRQMRAELSDAGITPRAVLSVTPLFSDKWIVIGET